MNAQLAELLRPEVLNTVNSLELMAKIVVEGFMSGGNKSMSVGIGQEFSQYRSYEPGDDLRQLDWKMYARSERYYVKQADIETNITVKFILDATNSMGYTESGITKLQYAKILIAALGYLARKQGDAIGFYSINDNRVRVIEPRFEHQQFLRFLNEILITKAETTWKKNNGLQHLHDHHRKDLIIFFTDLYDEQEDIHSFVSRLKTQRNEVIVLHLMGQQEIDLSFKGAFTFEDLETHQKIKINTAEKQKQYSSEVQKWIQHNRSWMLEKQIVYQLIHITEPPERVLRTFLTSRKKLV